MPFSPAASDLPDPEAADLEQRLRRALRVDPAQATAAVDSDTWSAAPAPHVDFWGVRPRSAVAWRRRIAAIVLVGGLAAAWIATSHLGRGAGPAASATVDATRPPVPTSGDPARNGAAPAVRTVDGVEVGYRRVGTDALLGAYLAAVVPGLRGGSMSLGPGSGPPACARGAEDERSWSRPEAPRRVVGRYACRIEQGRAAMWWTVSDRGLLGHAVAADADLASLFAWWESHSER